VLPLLVVVVELEEILGRDPWPDYRHVAGAEEVVRPRLGRAHRES
jgi:hypothetical protein